MKKLIVVFFICGIGVVACTKKAVPATSGTGTSGKTETVTTNTEIKGAADIKKEEGSNPPPVSMDMGKSLYSTKCGTCHALKNTGDYTGAQWDNILKSMVPKAKLSADETRQVTGYIKANAKM